MGVSLGPLVNNSGLVFSFDMYNIKTNAGAPITNTLPGGITNGYPIVGNSWGTYNTNQYNGNAYFSIGAISSVTSNIVTTSTAHPLRTYDAVTPQTTGGGVTAGTNYFVKKLSSTTFSLHAYDSTSDGSKGFRVHDSINNNTQIAINSTSFPTMWWGPPHLPNSALVKEIIPNGFNANGRIHDCIRLHYFRSDAADGMAYGVESTVTASVSWTVTFWTRAASASAVGKKIDFSIYNYTGGSAVSLGFQATIGDLGVWTKQSYTFTPSYTTCISYLFKYVSTDAPYSVDLSEFMYHLGTTGAEYTPASRSTTQSVIDRVGRCTATVSNLVYAADNTFTFNGTSSTVTLATPLSGGVATPFTLMAVAKTSTAVSWQTVIGTAGTFRQIGFNGTNFYYGGNGGGGNAFVIGGTIAANTWYHMVFTFDGTTAYGYLNGVQTTGSIGSNGGTIGSNYLGTYNGSAEYLNGSIGMAKIYNRALTQSEVIEAYRAVKTQYSLT